MKRSVEEMNEAEKLYRRGVLVGDLTEDMEPVNPPIKDALERAVERSYKMNDNAQQEGAGNKK